MVSGVGAGLVRKHWQDVGVERRWGEIRGGMMAVWRSDGCEWKQKWQQRRCSYEKSMLSASVYMVWLGIGLRLG